MGGAFQKPRVDIEYVAGKGFASRRAAQQQGKFAIGASVLCEIVVNDQDVAARFHERFRDAGRGVGRDVFQTRRIVTFGDHHHCVIHRALLAEIGNRLGDG